MKTRDRILECSLLLLNEQGEPNVSTLEIANELGISPGNLYYHFHGKEPLVMALFERFQAELAPLLDPPEEVRLGAEDYWLFLHLIVERLAHYRFLFQDLSNLTGRLPRLARGIRTWLGALKRTLATLLARLKADRQLRSDAPALGQLVEQITLTLLFSLDYQRVLGSKGEVRTVVYQIMMLVAPHLRSEAQRSAESLAQRYLGPE
ncbi:TPA: TetR/AcrR family transcriptional regulator [Pseudomonas aeruginosa]|uniref:TetR/AcrR family transcriptional regulator n=1 Tax=Pseudomonas aeruginosa TaxID=287 RepID=UPI004047000E